MNMRALHAALALIVVGAVSVAAAQAQPYRAGIVRMAVPADAPFDALVYYPTDAEESAWQAGATSIPAGHDADIANGKFPIVLLAHGGGLAGGSPLALSKLSASLARRGFIVVAPFHGKSGLRVRPTQIKLALDAMLADPRFGPRADAARLGMLGFSLGGAVTLQLAGATPDFVHFEAYCSSSHPRDVMSCDHAPDRKNVDSSPTGASSTRQAPLPLPPRLPLKAIVLLDPLAAVFTRDGLQSVTMPVLLFRPEQSQLSGEGNAIGLVAALPRRPQYQVLPGGHFVFVDACQPAQDTVAPEWCRDPPGVDRETVHADVELMIGKFFAENL